MSSTYQNVLETTYTNTEENTIYRIQIGKESSKDHYIFKIKKSTEEFSKYVLSLSLSELTNKIKDDDITKVSKSRTDIFQVIFLSKKCFAVKTIDPKIHKIQLKFLLPSSTKKNTFSFDIINSNDLVNNSNKLLKYLNKISFQYKAKIKEMQYQFNSYKNYLNSNIKKLVDYINTGIDNDNKYRDILKKELTEIKKQNLNNIITTKEQTLKEINEVRIKCNQEITNLTTKFEENNSMNIQNLKCIDKKLMNLHLETEPNLIKKRNKHSISLSLTNRKDLKENLYVRRSDSCSNVKNINPLENNSVFNKILDDNTNVNNSPYSFRKIPVKLKDPIYSQKKSPFKRNQTKLISPVKHSIKERGDSIKYRNNSICLDNNSKNFIMDKSNNTLSFIKDFNLNELNSSRNSKLSNKNAIIKEKHKTLLSVFVNTSSGIKTVSKNNSLGLKVKDSNNSLENINSVKGVKYYNNLVKDVYCQGISSTFAIYKSVNNMNILVYPTDKKTLEIYELLDNHILFSINKAHESFILSCRHFIYNIDKGNIKDLVITSSCNNEVKIWNIGKNSYNLLLQLTNTSTNSGFIYSCYILFPNTTKKSTFINLSKTINYVITSNSGETPINMYSLSTGTYIRNLGKESYFTNYLDSYKDEYSNYIIQCCSNGINAYDIDGKTIKKFNNDDKNKLSYMAKIYIDKNKKRICLFACYYNGEIRIWDFLNCNLIKKFGYINNNHNYLYGVRCICVWNDKYLITGGVDKKLKIYDYINGNCVKELSYEYTNSICDIVHFELPGINSSLFAVHGNDKMIRLYSYDYPTNDV